MKIKTQELTGPALVYAITIAKGLSASRALHHAMQEKAGVRNAASPLTWEGAGPIIDREKIQVTPLNQDNPRHGWAAAYKGRGEWGEDWFSIHRQRGITPIIAAMRCFVSAKLGDEVEVPDAVLKLFTETAKEVISEHADVLKRLADR